jgi:hypothetical protein
VSLASAGLLAAVCGAWFAIGPFAWTVVENTHPYFVGGESALRELAYLVGYALGVGLILTGCGSFALGWAVRHQRQPMVSTGDPATSSPAYAPMAQSPSYAAAPAPPQASYAPAPPPAPAPPSAPRGEPVAAGTPDAIPAARAPGRGRWSRRRQRKATVDVSDAGPDQAV